MMYHYLTIPLVCMILYEDQFDLIKLLYINLAASSIIVAS